MPKFINPTRAMSNAPFSTGPLPMALTGPRNADESKPSSAGFGKDDNLLINVPSVEMVAGQPLDS